MQTGKAALFREFHATWLRRMHIVPRGAGGACGGGGRSGGGGGTGGGGGGEAFRSFDQEMLQHRVLILDKKESAYVKMGVKGLGRRILNFKEIQAVIERELSFAVDITTDDYVRMPAREQICMLHDYTVILSPQGGMRLDRRSCIL